MTSTIGVVGAGITGLAAAICLTDSGYKVNMLARDIPGDEGFDWASPWAGAGFHPQLTNDKTEQEMQKRSFEYYWNLAESHPTSGVERLPMREYFDDDTTISDIWYSELMPDFKVLPTSSLPPNVKFGVSYSTTSMNPQLLLSWLSSSLLQRGVTIQRATVTSLSEAAKKLGTDCIVNATGVGAGVLAGDASVESVRGQTLFIPTTFNEILIKTGSEYTYVIPRKDSGGVVMGGIKMYDRTDATVDEDVRADIVRRVKALTGDAFKDLDVSSGISSIKGAKDIVGFRPGRKDGLRVERDGNVIHAYGAGGAGYIYSFGVAARVVDLVRG